MAAMLSSLPKSLDLDYRKSALSCEVKLKGEEEMRKRYKT